MAASFTPGPWTAAVFHNRDGFGIHATPRRGHSIAAANLFEHDAYIGHFSSEETDANARLIAASPRMYDFIKKFADCGDVEAQTILGEIEGTS